ncbi:hypothetical protein QTN25_006394 [Entamoeba marina]
MRTFPNLQTLRIDIHSLSEIQCEINESGIIMIDVVHSKFNTNITKINESLLDKFITSFDGIIRENTKQLYYNYETDTLNQINNNSKISFVYVQTFSDSEPEFINDLINDLNSINNSVKIRLNLSKLNSLEIANYFNKKNSNITLVQSNNNNKFVIIDENHVELSVSPFKNTEMMRLYEKYYLPTSITIPCLQGIMNDFTLFKYIKTFRIKDYHVGGKTFLHLPTTTQIFDFNVAYEAAIEDIQITNWNDLSLLKEINHSGNLDIPYPQIKYERNTYKMPDKSWFSIMISTLSIFCCLTLLYSFGNIIYSLLFHKFDFDYLSQKLIIPTLIYYHICAFILLVLFLIFFMIMKKLETLISSLLLICFYISILTYGYSLYQYTSKWFILTNILGIPPPFLTFLNTFLIFTDLNSYYLIKYLKLSFRNWVSATTLFHGIRFLKEKFVFLIIASIIFLFLQIGIGLFISFLNTHGSLSYLCLGCIISFIGLSALLIVLIIKH